MGNKKVCPINTRNSFFVLLLSRNILQHPLTSRTLCNSVIKCLSCLDLSSGKQELEFVGRSDLRFLLYFPLSFHGGNNQQHQTKERKTATLFLHNFPLEKPPAATFFFMIDIRVTQNGKERNIKRTSFSQGNFFR